MERIGIALVVESQDGGGSPEEMRLFYLNEDLFDKRYYNHEVIDDMFDSLNGEYEKELIYDSLVRIFTPYPGLDIFDNPSMYGITILTYDWDRYRRFSFPPVHRLVDLNEYELCNYIFLMKSIQIKHYAKWAGMEKECYDFFWNFSEKYFWKMIPP